MSGNLLKFVGIHVENYIKMSFRHEQRSIIVLFQSQKDFTFNRFFHLFCGEIQSRYALVYIVGGASATNGIVYLCDKSEKQSHSLITNLCSSTVSMAAMLYVGSFCWFYSVKCSGHNCAPNGSVYVCVYGFRKRHGKRLRIYLFQNQINSFIQYIRLI